MLYNIHRWNPKLIAIPDIGIGLMWGSLGNVVAFYAYTFTNSASGIAKIQSLATVVGVFTQIIIGILSDKTHHKWGKRTPWIVYGTLLASASICIWPFVHSFIAFLIMVGITCTLVNVVQCTYYTMLIEVVDSNQIGYANTLARTAGNLGGLFMGVLAGFLWNHQHPHYSLFQE